MVGPTVATFDFESPALEEMKIVRSSQVIYKYFIQNDLNSNL